MVVRHIVDSGTMTVCGCDLCRQAFRFLSRLPPDVWDKVYPGG